MRFSMLICLTLTLGLMLPMPKAWAQSIYKWVDEDGEVHYSQTLPPEQVESGHDRLSREGLTTERVQRAPTEQERGELEARLRHERDAAEQQRIRNQQDRLFLASFPSEEDVRRSMQSRRETIEGERASVVDLIEVTRERFSEQVREAAARERAGKDVPQHRVEAIADLRERLQAMGERLVEIDQRLADLDAELAAQLQRHRRLAGPGQGRGSDADSGPDSD